MSRRKKQTTNARDKTAYFSRSDDEVELLQYLTPNKRLKKKLLSRTQKTSCCPLCWISDRERFGKINHMTNWRERIQKVPDTKSSLSALIEKSCVFKLFHSRECIQKVPFSRIFLCGYVRCSVDGRPNRNNKVAFSNLSGIVWTRPELLSQHTQCIISLSNESWVAIQFAIRFETEC